MTGGFYLFRVDDVCPTQKAEWFRLKQLLERLAVRPILAVIPDCRDPELAFEPARSDFWSEIRALQTIGWTIAQHGYQHLYRSNAGGILDLNGYGEFPGLSYDDQCDKIQCGRDILLAQNVSTDLFVAPAHAFDYVTLRALADCGFQYLSDGIGLFPFAKEGLLWVPQVWWDPVEMPIGIHTICVHPQSMTEEKFQTLESFIVSHRDRIIDFDWIIEWSQARSLTTRAACACLNALFRPLWWWNRSRYSARLRGDSLSCG
jgi:predicted deacetylase